MTKGIILAGGSGSRLHPMTISVSKQLMPVYDKPMIYYPLSTLMQAGIREILAQAFIIGEEFIQDSRVCLILGDNIFYGNRIEETLRNASTSEGACIFAHYVNDPERYGVVALDSENRAIDLEEKPRKPKSNYAVTGIYMYDSDVIEIAKSIQPSERGELEITDLNKKYMLNNALQVELFDRGTAWLDTGTIQSLLDAANFIRVLEERQGLKIGCPEEIAFRQNFITASELANLAQDLDKSGYGQYLSALLDAR